MTADTGAFPVSGYGFWLVVKLFPLLLVISNRALRAATSVRMKPRRFAIQAFALVVVPTGVTPFATSAAFRASIVGSTFVLNIGPLAPSSRPRQYAR